MCNRLRVGVALCLVSIVAIGATGCGEKAPEVQDPVDAKPKGPDYEVFAPLDQARMDVVVPMLVGADDEGCFLAAEGVEPAEADIVTKELVADNQSGVTGAIVKWLVEDLAPSGLTTSLANGWTITVEDLAVLDVPRDKVRFGPDPQCLSKSGWLEDGKHLATTLIGALKINFEAKLPVTQDLQEEMLRAVGLKSIVMESESLFVYEQAVGGDGMPMQDPEGNQLYTSPSGEFIPEKDVPPVEARKMTKWSFSAPKPIYFAFKEFPRDGWRKEGERDKCNVIIIPDALTPQPPDCAEFQESGFAVTVLENEDKPVSLTIKTGEEIKGVQLAWKEAAKIQVNDRIILWIMPEMVEVGVNLWVNSLTINPAPMPGGSAGGDGPAYEDVPVDQDKEAEAEEKKEKAGDKKPKKKGKKASEDALDSYLND